MFQFSVQTFSTHSIILFSPIVPAVCLIMLLQLLFIVLVDTMLKTNAYRHWCVWCNCCYSIKICATTMWLSV